MTFSGKTDTNPVDPTAAQTLTATVHTALFAALIAVGAYIVVPLPFSPVPLVLQNMLVLLAGVLLGPRRGVLAVLLYLGLGTVGLPVFAGGAAGPATFLGPTAGYLVSYLPAAALSGALTRGFPSRARVLAAAGGGAALILAGGTAGLVFVAGLGPLEAVMVGAAPFLPGDALKVVAIAAVYRRVAPLFGALQISEAGADEDLREAPRRDAPSAGAANTGAPSTGGGRQNNP